MMRIACVLGLVFFLALVPVSGLWVEAASAAGYEWRDHALPFDFLFGNEFDMHQQSRLAGGELQGFQYIRFTGATRDGYPEALHGQAAVGWIMHGIPGNAVLVDLSMHGPVWGVPAAQLPSEPGYVHFHWTGPGGFSASDLGKAFPGFFLKHTAIDTFFFPDHGSLVTPGVDYQFHPNIVVLP